jgi:hypothetical protein
MDDNFGSETGDNMWMNDDTRETKGELKINIYKDTDVIITVGRLSRSLAQIYVGFPILFDSPICATSSPTSFTTSSPILAKLLQTSQTNKLHQNEEARVYVRPRSRDCRKFPLPHGPRRGPRSFRCRPRNSKQPPRRQQALPCLSVDSR